MSVGAAVNHLRRHHGQMFVRAAQHEGISVRTEHQLIKPPKSFIQNHCTNQKPPFNVDNCTISGSTESKSLHILNSSSPNPISVCCSVTHDFLIHFILVRYKISACYFQIQSSLLARRGILHKLSFFSIQWKQVCFISY